jgi:hypothetical protein
VWNGASRTRREATSCHAPGLGRERGVQSEGREEALLSHRGRLRARDSGGEVARVTRSDATRGEGQAGRHLRKRGAVSERKRKREKNAPGAVLRHVFMERKCAAS